MTKRETFELFTLIAVYYDQFVFDQQKLNSWHQVLQAYTFAEVERNLLAYTAISPYAPKIADLCQAQTAVSRVIPNIAETVDQLVDRSVFADEQLIEKELSKVREILAKKRGEGS